MFDPTPEAMKTQEGAERVLFGVRSLGELASDRREPYEPIPPRVCFRAIGVNAGPNLTHFMVGSPV